MAEKEITILICKPHSKPELRTIENNAEKIKEIVGGDYDDVVDGEGLAILFNPEGGDLGYDLNRLVGGEPVFGNIIICRRQDNEICSLSEDELEEMNYLLS